MISHGANKRSHKGFRTDIQALRGIAVLLVLFFHAEIGGLSAGYLGVDIFFVISGFLITGLVARRIAEGRFSFKDFYIRRARRLLPAAYIVYAFTLFIGMGFLTTHQFAQLTKSLMGALTFTANITLWQGTDYFAAPAKFDPLLHVWSLSLEEQFYIVLPLALFFIPKRSWLKTLSVGVMISFFLCVLWVSKYPVSSFYLLPTRAWEFGIGSVAALWVFSRGEQALPGSQALKRYIPVCALIGMLGTALLSPGAQAGFPHPGPDALIVCLTTCLILLYPLHAVGKDPLSRSVCKIGDMSYSLYLVHWPLFAFAKNAWLGETVPLSARAFLLCLSVLLGWALWRCVENPWRFNPPKLMVSRPIMMAVVPGLLLVNGAMAVNTARADQQDKLAFRTINHGLSAACDQGDHFNASAQCRTGENPTVLVWGDSYAMHLIPGLKKVLPHDFAQATKTSCGAVNDVGRYDLRWSLTREWAQECMAFNRSVTNYLSSHPEIDTVIMSTMLKRYTAERPEDYEWAHSSTDTVTKRMQTAFIDTVATVEAMGKRVIIIGPTPTVGFDIGLCHERRRMDLVRFGVDRDCSLSEDSFRAQTRAQSAILEAIDAKTGAKVLRLEDYLCDGTHCRTLMGTTPLYRDIGHLSVAGAEVLFIETGLRQALIAATGISENRMADAGADSPLAR